MFTGAADVRELCIFFVVVAYFAADEGVVSVTICTVKATTVKNVSMCRRKCRSACLVMAR